MVRGCDCVAQPTGRQCLVSRAGRRRREQTVEFSQPLFSLATQTEPRLPRSTGRRNIKVTLTPRPFHGDLTSLFFVAGAAKSCASVLVHPHRPLRAGAYQCISIKQIRLGVPIIPAGDEVSPMVYNPRLIRVRIQSQMTHKRTRHLIPTSTALAAVGARLCLRGR